MSYKFLKIFFTLKTVQIADRNNCRQVFLHWVLGLVVDVRLFDLHVGAVFGELLILSV
jgi:hypothetical protein